MEKRPASAKIEIRQLSVGYTDKRRHHVLFRDLNLRLNAGELTCFMGPNGIGKSTLIRTILGLQQPLEGEIVFSVDGPESAPDRAKNIAAVLTDRVSAVNMDVVELVSFGRYPYLGWSATLDQADHEIVSRAMDQVRITHLGTKRIYELSDGQLQLVMIARALAQDTPIIVLDEPTAHLDLNNRLEIMNLLRKLAHTLDKAILVSTHELDLALQTADVIWLAGEDEGMSTGIPEDLVLTGAFDHVFQFKGFDLKSGKVYHEIVRTATIRVIGQGYAYLWTKNALERCGYRIVDQDEAGIITINTSPEGTTWDLDHNFKFRSIGDLLDHLQSTFH
jgi:iron complex transport system ATP-binding protein